MNEKPDTLADVRVLIVGALFVVFIYCLTLVAFLGSLKENQLFTAMATGVLNLLSMGVGYFLGSSKGASDANARADAANRRADDVKDGKV